MTARARGGVGAGPVPGRSEAAGNAELSAAG